MNVPTILAALLLSRDLTPFELELTDTIVELVRERDDARDDAQLWKNEAETCHELKTPPPTMNSGLPDWVWAVGLVAVAAGSAALGASL